MTDPRRATGRPERPGAEDNPFAPPPEGRPDQPWQPRLPRGDRDPDASGEDGGAAPDRDSGRDSAPDQDQRQRWGSQWSRRQPGRQDGGFGDPPSGSDGGPGGFGARGWDPSDPAQRHARYAVLGGMWGVLTGLLGWDWLALLLGALALYWGISALRGGPKESAEARDRRVAALTGRAPGPAPARPAPPGGERPQRAAAVSGIVLASAALLIVAATYTFQLVYRDYFSCVEDALTSPSRAACETHLPSELRPYLGED
jgi:hypothetical protein